MERSNGSNYDSKSTTNIACRPRPNRRGRKRKHTSDVASDPDTPQPATKRLITAGNRHSPYVEDASSATASRPTIVVQSSPDRRTVTVVGLSMPSISSSGGSSVGAASTSHTTATSSTIIPASSEHSSDTQGSSSDCFSNGVEFDLLQLPSPTSVSSSTVLSPPCAVDDTGVRTGAAGGEATTAAAAFASPYPHHHHHHHHYESWYLPHHNHPPHQQPLHADDPATLVGEKQQPCGDGGVALFQDCYFTPSHKQRDCRIPSLSWADNEAMWVLMCRKDDLGWLAREPDMFHDHPGLQPRMRSILLDWLNEVCEVYKMYRETYYLAVDYIDRYLSRKKGLRKTHLQLLGVTALFIASKVEEIYPPKLRDFAYVTDGACSEEDILREEVLLLSELDWNINPLTVIGWLGMYMQINVTSRDSDNQLGQVHPRVAAQQQHPATDLKLSNAKSSTPNSNTCTIGNKPEEKPCSGAAGATKKTDDAFVYPQFSAMEFAHTAQLIDLCSLDIGMANFKYSVIAAAAISHTFDRKTATFVSGMNWEEIAPCAKWMEPFFQVICEENAVCPLTFPEQNEQIKTGLGLSLITPHQLADLYFSKQTHTTSLEMLDAVAIKIEQMESTTRMVQLEASPAPLGTIVSENGILTPPASNQKSLEMLTIPTDGGGAIGGEGIEHIGAGGTAVEGQQQHAHLHHRHHQLTQGSPQRQLPPGHGVKVKEIALK